MLLSAARTRVLNHLDDADGTRFNIDATFTEIDLELRSAQQEVWQECIGTSPSSFTQEGSVTATSGVASLTSLAPALILSVATYAGGVREKVSPMRLVNQPQNYTSTRDLRITYVPRVSFPASASNEFAWGARTTGIDFLNALTCALAAKSLSIKIRMNNPPLDDRIQDLTRKVREMLAIPGWAVLPLDPYSDPGCDSGLGFVMTAPDTLQLVIA
jgi:hypothetical protein